MYLPTRESRRVHVLMLVVSTYRQFLLGLSVFQDCLFVCLQLICEKEKANYKRQVRLQRQTIVFKGGEYFLLKAVSTFISQEEDK